MKIESPTNCPSCGGKLELVNAQLFCRNSTLCPAQNSKLLESFCKKMKVKGFGPATLEKLELLSIASLFYITEDELVSVLGEKVGKKLYREIELKIKGVVDFGQLLGSLGIPLIGDVAARKLAEKYQSFDSLKAEGKAGVNLEAWLNSEIGREIVLLPWNFETTEHKQEASSVETNGITVCITGSLDNFKNRAEASSYLEGLGYIVKKSVTKDLNYLICEDSTKVGSSSYKKAVANGTPVVTINDLIDLQQ